MRIFGVSLVTLLLLAFAYWLGSKNAVGMIASKVGM